MERNDDEYEFTDTYPAENVRPIRSRAHNTQRRAQTVPQEVVDTTPPRHTVNGLPEEGFEDLYQQNAHKPLDRTSGISNRKAPASDRGGRIAHDFDPREEDPVVEEPVPVQSASTHHPEAASAPIFSNNMGRISVGLLTILVGTGLYIAYRFIPVSDVNRDTSALPTATASRYVVDGDSGSLRGRDSSLAVEGFGSPAGDYRHQQTDLQVREAKLLASNNSKALANLSAQLVEVHQKVNAQVEDVQMAQQATVEVGSLMMEIKGDLDALSANLQSLNQTVSKNTASIEKLSTSTSGKRPIEARAEPSSNQVAAAPIRAQGPEPVGASAPKTTPVHDYQVLSDYEILAISTRGALVRQRSNPAKRFFLLKEKKYEFFGRVFVSNTTDKELIGTFPSGRDWIIKGS